MKVLVSAVILSLASCTESPKDRSQTIADSSTTSIQSTKTNDDKVKPPQIEEPEIKDPVIADPAPMNPSPQTGKQVYSNQRFRNVIVVNSGNGKYAIQGEAQIFEANFSWVIEDGHKEIKKGFEMTDAGAPEWGKFHFNVNARKTNPNSTLHLILFEISAKDGSRQHELPIPLP